MKTNSFCISKQANWNDRSNNFEQYITTIPTIQVGSVYLYKNKNGTWEFLHKCGLSGFWLSKGTKQQAIRWAKRELIQIMGNLCYNEVYDMPISLRKRFKEEFEYSVFWGLNSFDDLPDLNV